jgi:hypothetical protein
LDGVVGGEIGDDWIGEGGAIVIVSYMVDVEVDEKLAASALPRDVDVINV